MLKRIFSLMFAFSMLFALTCAPSDAAIDPNSCGLIIGEEVIRPGEKMVMIFGMFGAPDQIWSMRGKKDRKSDYIKFDYIEPNITFDITNEENEIRSILVKTDSVKLRGIPFKVGDTYDSVKASWGEPDKKEGGYANYVKKGVMFKLSDTGIVELIAIFAPNNDIDSEDQNRGAEKS